MIRNREDKYTIDVADFELKNYEPCFRCEMRIRILKTDKKGQYCVQFELLSGEKLFFERRFNYLKDKYLSVTADE